MSTLEESGVELVCPECRSQLVRETERLVCREAQCRRAYAIVDGIPKMLVEDAEILTAEAWNQIASGNGGPAASA